MENVKKRCKKASALQGKETFTQALVSVTQTEISHIESESQNDTNKRLDDITTADKYIV